MDTRPLQRDETTPATMFDPALTYYADGTTLTMTTVDTTRTGIACGRTKGSPYDFQAVQFDTELAHVAPHVLTRA